MAGPRTEAPGDLRLIQRFCNSVANLYGVDALASPADATAWFAENGELSGALRLDRRTLHQVVEVREAVRALLGGTGTAETTAVLNECVRRSHTTIGWAVDGTPSLVLEPPDGVPGYLGRVLAALFQAGQSGDLARLKTCQAPECRWVFYDRSKNRTGVWCRMDVCGARHKMRAYRSRKT